jgi:hypothetical protein
MNFKKQYEIMKESFIKIIGLFSSLDGDEKGRRNKIHDVKHRHLIGDYTSYEDPQRIKIIKGLIHSINHYQEINEKELSLDLIKALENYIIDWKEEIRNVSNKQDCENNDNGSASLSDSWTGFLRKDEIKNKYYDPHSVDQYLKEHIQKEYKENTEIEKLRNHIKDLEKQISEHRLLIHILNTKLPNEKLTEIKSELEKAIKNEHI